MYRFPFTWLRSNSFSWIFAGLAALAVCGCAQPPPDDNGNDNEPSPVCGDGVVESPETCDDSNTDDGDGCSSTCLIEPDRPEPECGDGVVDRSETCDDGNTVNGDGCSSTCLIETPAPPRCGDGVVNGTEQCDGGIETATCNVNCTTSRCGDGIVNTHAGEECDDGNTDPEDGCAANCLIETGGGGGPRCGDGIVNGAEQCDTGGQSATCNSNCTTASCGDGIVNTAANEQCDDGNTNAGDGCGATCQNEGGVIPNDDCDAPIAVGDGTRTYNTIGATTDGPDEPTACDFEFGNSNVEADIWYCYTATCTGTALASLCGSDYDTKLAVYSGCSCPTATPLGCSDDDCGTGTGNFQSRVEFPATAGLSYMVRVGGFSEGQGNGDQGNGRLTIACNVDACASGSGDCFAASPTPETPGCGDAVCCAEICALDQFCCDVTWDTNCAAEASGLCEGGSGFPACGPPNARSCGTPAADNTPGCANGDCCNTVCTVDPYCCNTEWDLECVNEAESMCFLTCGPGGGGGDCHTANMTPGCDSQACCEAVCATDPFCCETRWDLTCVNAAAASPACQ